MKITLLASGTIHSNFTYRVLQLSRSLVKRGHEVSIIVPTADKYNDFKFQEVSNIDGVKIIQPFQFKTRRLEVNLIPYILHTAYIIFRNRSDLIYIYKPTPITIVGFLGKILYKTPVFLDMDDLGSEVMRIEGHPAFQRKLVEWCEKIALRFSDRVVVVSTYLRDLFIDKFPKKNIIIIPNGVDADWFSPIIESDRNKRIVFLGAINRKNILEPLFDVLPSIITIHPDLEVLVIGDGKFLQYFKEKSTESGLDKHITFTGWMSLDNARKMLKQGDIGYNYMPDEVSTRAASNMKVPQYMSRGVVPLVSDVGDLKSNVDFGKAGYISKPDNLQELEKTLLFALEDKDILSKSSMAIDRASNKFSWDYLAVTFENWVLPTKINGKKRVFVVCVSIPGNFGGGEIRNYNLIRQLSKTYDVEVFCISTKNIEKEKNKLESDLGVKCHIVKEPASSLVRITKSVLWDRVPPFMNNFSTSSVGRVLEKCSMENMPFAVHLAQIHAYYAIKKYIPWLRNNGVKIVLDCHNVEYKVFEDSLNVFKTTKKTVGKFMVPKYKKLEIEGTKKSNMILACSQTDVDFFKKYNKSTFLIPNGVDTKEFELERDHFNPVIIFMGGVGYPPNEDAIRFYLSQIHPIIKKQIPNIKFLAVGAEEEWLKNNGFAEETVSGLGFVPNVNTYLQKASVGICPIRYGSGTRLKILTYMASFLPVVSTSKGAEGVQYVNGRDIFINDTPDMFAQSILKLLSNKELAIGMGRSGHDFVEKNYDWNVVGEILKGVYEKI